MSGEIPSGVEGSVTVAVTGLSVYTHHGVEEAERQVGQRLVFDLSFELDHCDAVVTDRIEDTVDYESVSDVVALTASERPLKTLERLSQKVADRLLERFSTVRLVTVRVAKTEPPMALSVEEVAVELTVERDEHEDEDEAEGVGGE